jgi:hypothetical protein
MSYGAYTAALMPGLRKEDHSMTFRYMRLTFTTLSVLLTVLATDAFLAPVGAAAGSDTPAIAEKCRKDLTGRLHLKADAVKMLQVRRVTWPDAALGLPRPGYAYAQALTPGWSLVLQANGGRYLYTAGERTFRYGGPLSAWTCSALYVEAVENEPNLNGNLVQVSLVGTNPTILLSGVSDFYPQENGAILATRRISRSGYELLYLAPGAVENAGTLMTALYFGSAAIGPSGSEWAAFTRASFGAPLTVILGDIGKADVKTQILELPVGSQPVSLSWQDGRLLAWVQSGGKAFLYQGALKDGAWTWRKSEPVSSPSQESAMLNKSESLVVKRVEADGKPATRVVREWFNGDENLLTTLVGFRYRNLTMTPENRFAFLQGDVDGKPAAYTVDVHTGESLLSVSGSLHGIKLFFAPPRTRLEMQAFRGK